MAFDAGMFGGGLGQLLGGLFGNTDKAYNAANKQYMNWANKSQQAQQPWLNAGQQAIPDYQRWLQRQQNPSGFINNLMGQYNESPYAKYQQQQSLNAGQNAASASGLMGSTPLMQQLQQNAQNISSQDQNQWLQHVLGINTQYGAGQHNLINNGQNSANALTNMYGDMGRQMGENDYNKAASRENNKWNTIGGGLGILGSFL